MLSFRRKLLIIFFKLSDMCILIFALLTAFRFTTYHRNAITLGTFFSLRIKVVNLVVFAGILLSWHLVFNGFQLYRSRRLGNKLQEWKDILKATTMGVAILMLVRFIFNIKAFTPPFIAFFWLSSTILTISFRSLLRYALVKVRLHGRNLRLVVIVGTNQRAYDFADKIEGKKEIGYRVVGYIDNDIHQPKEGVKLLGTIEDFPITVKKHVIDEVFIALPIKSFYEEILKIVQKAEEQGITIRYPSLLFDTKVAQLRVETLDDFTVLTIASRPPEDWRYLAKRAIDIMFGTVLMIAAFPLIILTAIAIKLTSPGPIFFIQDRIGYNKRLFRLYKFRTMVVGAEKLQSELETLNEMDGPVFKIRNDPRITKVGRWLRRTSVDELPQLFNVLKGDMSLVGPRPLPVRDYNGFTEDWQRRRFSVLPGLTCTWQISGRNHISFEDWMKLDMKYIDNWKLSNDLKILLKTIIAVTKMKGAI